MRNALFACLILLVACTNLDDLRKTEPAGTPFQTSLSQMYLGYASDEQRNYHWFNAEHFAGKGLKLAKGEDAQADEPTSPDMNIAHDKLIAALSAKAKETKPDAAAAAQFNYDCWNDQQRNYPDGEKLVECRDLFFAALDALGGNAPMAAVLNPVDKPSDMVFFEWDKSNLTEEGDATLSKIIDHLRSDKKAYKITLGGHTDTTGTQRYNLGLSQRRADTVKDAMVAGGIDAARIKVFAYGKSDPLIQTGDNVREPRNRRVEIFISEPK